MRVLTTFAGGHGHLVPMLPLARALGAAGHELALSGHPDHARGHGLFTSVFPHERGPVDPADPADQADGGTGTLVAPDLEHELAVIGRWYAGTLAQQTVARTMQAIDAWRPDLLVCDEMDFGSISAAARMSVPSVVVDVIATGALTRGRYVDEPLTALGLDPAAPRGDVAVSPFPSSWRAPGFPMRVDAAVVRPESAGDAGTGPAHPAAAWLGEDDGPAAYVTLGTVFNRESGDLLSRLVEGLLDGPGRVLVTVGPDLDPGVVRARSSRLRVERYVPQDQALDHADVVVCHGGSGSLMGALSRGVPVVVAALGADQGLNAARVEALGVGAVLDPVRCTPEEVSATVTHVRGDPGVRGAVARVRAEIEALPPAATLVPELEALVHRSRRRAGAGERRRLDCGRDREGDLQ